MTKDEFIEAMAARLHEEMSDKPNPSCRVCRRRVTLLMPVIVRFVEDWIERDGNFDDEAVDRASRWHHDASGEAVTT